MAYLRKEKGTIEIPYSLSKVWSAITKVLTSLEFDTEQIDDKAHHIKAKTKSGLMSWSSVFIIAAESVDEKNTRVSIAADTPVTTITAMFDFGRTRQRMDLFFTELAKQLAS